MNLVKNPTNQKIIKKKIVLMLTVSIACLGSGCMTTMNKTWDENKGKIIGGGTGAVLGALACDGDPLCIAGGAIAGIALGGLWDKRQKDIAKLAEEQNIALQTKKVNTFNAEKQSGLEVTIDDSEMFEVGSAELSSKSKQYFQSLANIYSENPQKIMVVGHTDATGSSEYNLDLSEKRAKAVAQTLADSGIPKQDIYFQGVGESQPIASNDTDDGRTSNRRVEIIEVDSIESIAAYSLERKSDSRFVSHSSKTTKEKAQVNQHSSKSQISVPTSDVEVNEKVDESMVENDITNTPKTDKTSTALVDFGGVPASSNSSVILAAGQQVDDSFSFFSTAYASESMTPCFMDSPRVAGAIQSLSDGEKLIPENVLKLNEIAQTDYWPGANGSVWIDTVNGHLMALNGMRILKQTGGAIGQPEVLLYKDYSKGNKEVSYKMPIHIETYKGTDGLLVRSYFSDNSPYQCTDFVLGNNSYSTAKAGIIYYQKGTEIYEKKINLRRIKSEEK